VLEKRLVVLSTMFLGEESCYIDASSSCYLIACVRNQLYVERRKNRFLNQRFILLLLAPGKGFEPLRARGSPANLPFGLALFVLDLEAGALTTPPPRRVHTRLCLLCKNVFQHRQNCLIDLQCCQIGAMYFEPFCIFPYLFLSFCIIEYQSFKP
jgi:hypothetical protein